MKIKLKIIHKGLKKNWVDWDSNPRLRGQEVEFHH